MNLLDAIRSRRAIRAFSAEPIDRAAIESLVGIAVEAPSAMNRQPWRFLVVNGRARLQGLSERMREYLLEQMPDESPLRQHLADPDAEILHGAPALIVVCATHAAEQDKEDCCLAAMTLMLAAHAQGYGTCWIGLARPWLQSAEGRAELQIPQDIHPVAPIVIGRPLALPPPTPRHAPVVFWRD